MKLCADCRENNNGWCKMLKKNGLKTISECEYYNNIKIDWKKIIHISDTKDLLVSLLDIIENGNDINQIKKKLKEYDILL